MRQRLQRTMCVAVSVVWLNLSCPSANASERPPANVPPTLEIEVLDPNADPLGRPAVELRNGPAGGQVVDIPPAVLVHRYYYTGDRSFQAQLLPGGPTIIVINHPKTNERLYVDVQMMPGAPRVTYTGRNVCYDYGKHGMTLHFRGKGAPIVKYRYGRTWHKAIDDLVHTEELRECAGRVRAASTDLVQRSCTMTYGALAYVADATLQITLPVQNVLASVPIGRQLFSGQLEENLTTKAAQHRREAELRRLERRRDVEGLTIPTVRGGALPAN